MGANHVGSPTLVGSVARRNIDVEPDALPSEDMQIVAEAQVGGMDHRRLRQSSQLRRASLGRSETGTLTQLRPGQRFERRRWLKRRI
jgi:hypothetical protein